MSTTTTPPGRGAVPTLWSSSAARTGIRSSLPPPRPSTGERIVVNMGPQHPSTHGVLRLILEIEGETITEARCGIGYLHTGIEKNLEYRNWTQGVTFVTRMDYLSPFFNETAYCLGVEKLLGVTDDIPERATVIRVMMMELNRISSHLVALATGGMELGAMSAMFYGFREREQILSRVRDDHRAANEQRLHPSRRAGRRPARRSDPPAPRPTCVAAQAVTGPRGPAQRELHLEGPHGGRRLSRSGRLHGAGHHRTGAALHRVAARPAQGAALLRVRDIRLRRHHRRRAAIPTAATSFGSRRCASRSRSSSSACSD